MDNEFAPQLVSLHSLEEQARTRVFTAPDDAEFFNSSIRQRAANQVVFRQLVERAVVRLALAEILENRPQYFVRLYDGGRPVVFESRRLGLVMSAIRVTGREVIIIRRYAPDLPLGSVRIGSIDLSCSAHGGIGIDEHTQNDEMCSLLAPAKLFANVYHQR